VDGFSAGLGEFTVIDGSGFRVTVGDVAGAGGTTEVFAHEGVVVFVEVNEAEGQVVRRLSGVGAGDQQDENQAFQRKNRPSPWK